MNHKHKSQTYYTSLILTLSLSLSGISSAFAPWIWRESVALQLTGPGLAEFIKFLPEVRTGQIQIERLYIQTPLFLTILTLPLFIENKHLHLPTWLRLLLRLTVIPLALASLPPVWTPTILIAPEFRLQTTLAITAIILTTVAPIFKHLTLRWPVIILTVGGIAAIILPIQTFNLIQEAISQAYNQPVSLAWGQKLTVISLISSIIVGFWLNYHNPPPHEDIRTSG